jgi:hypothetical protein
MKLRICLIILTVLVAAAQGFSFDTTKVKSKKFIPPEERNVWNLGVIYGDKGFGVIGGVYKAIGSEYDIYADLSFSGVTDSREIEMYDEFGNIVVANKENRIFSIPLTIGIQKYLFKDDIDGSFKPYFTLGIAPTLLFTTPYNESYFKAFGKAQMSFAFGGFAGMGLEFSQGRGMSLAIGAKYYYLPVIGREINSLKNTPITDVGGIQLYFGLNFLR